MGKGLRTSIALFICPTAVIYSLFIIIPVIFSTYYSLTDWNGIGRQTFIGIENFIDLFKDGDFLTSFKNTISVTIVSLMIQIPVGLILAYFLYRGIKGFKIFRAIYFLPVVIAPIAIGLLFTLLLNGETGPLNNFLRFIGLSHFQKAWLSDPSVVLYSVMSPQVWQFIGLYIVIFLARLQSIPEEIIESAHIDGAGSIQIFFKIILPLVWDVIQLSIILCFTGSLKSFDYSWIMTAGGPGVRSSYLGVYMFKAAFINTGFGTGSAVTVIILFTALLFTMVFRKITSKEIY